MSKNLFLFFSGIFFSAILTFFVNFSQKKLENFFVAQITKPLEEINFVKIEKPKKPPLEIEAKAVLSLRINPKKKVKEKILYSKNENEILPIASLTKLMTALIVLENSKDYELSKLITISKESADQGNVPHYGNLDDYQGKNFTVEELLNLMLVYSSNDAAWALAEEIGVDNFVKKMNEKARDLGLESTHFVNPTGLDSQNSFSVENFNYSTAKDLLKISRYILEKHPLIFEISKKKPLFPIKNGIHELTLTGEIVGGKTGYTKKAGGSIVFIFKNGEDIFVNIILGTESEEARIKEMQKLIDWLLLKL